MSYLNKINDAIYKFEDISTKARKQFNPPKSSPKEMTSSKLSVIPPAANTNAKSKYFSPDPDSKTHQTQTINNDSRESDRHPPSDYSQASLLSPTSISASPEEPEAEAAEGIDDDPEDISEHETETAVLQQPGKLSTTFTSILLNNTYKKFGIGKSPKPSFNSSQDRPSTPKNSIFFDNVSDISKKRLGRHTAKLLIHHHYLYYYC